MINEITFARARAVEEDVRADISFIEMEVVFIPAWSAAETVILFNGPAAVFA